MTNTKTRLVRVFSFLLVLLALPSSAVMIIQGGGPRHFKAAAAAAGNGEASNYTLELVSPRQAGTAPSVEAGTPNMPTGHRIFKAYPGIEYNIRAVVIGGSYPYSCSLSGGVAWLSVDASTCVISGTAPSDPNGTEYTPTLTVTDDEDTSRSEPWTITITTVGFKFVDSVNDGSGDTGTLAAPYDSFEQMKAGTVAGDITYFRNGTYSTNITPDDTGGSTGEFEPEANWKRINLSGDAKSVQWIAYPGESPIIDGGYVQDVTQGNLVRIGGGSTYPVYLDGLEFRNYYHIGLQLTSGHYAAMRRLNMHDIANNFNGGNSAVIDTISMVGSVPRYYVSYMDNNIHDNKPGVIKLYWHYKSLIADNTFASNGGIGAMVGADPFAAGPDHKAVVARFEVRANVYTNCPSTGDVPDANGTSNDSGFGGNMNDDDDVNAPGDYSTIQASGEVRYNKFGCSSRPGLRIINLNNFNETGAVYVYRNTGIGRWNVENSDGNGTNTGPFSFYNNIIINDVGAGNTDRITFSGGTPGTGGELVYGAGGDANLSYDTTTGASVVDANLNLTGSYRTQYLGSKGAELQ